MSLTYPTETITTEQVTLQKLRVAVCKAVDDLCMSDVQVSSFTQRMAYELRAYVLADHIDDRSYSYEEIEFPKWLKWLKRFCRVTPYTIKADAYDMYPHANIKLPELGQNYITFNLSKLNMSDFA